MVKVVIEFSEATVMSDRGISGVHQAILCEQDLSLMVMEGIYKTGLPKSIYKGLLNQS